MLMFFLNLQSLFRIKAIQIGNAHVNMQTYANHHQVQHVTQWNIYSLE
jgi:hypothetical protein